MLQLLDISELGTGGVQSRVGRGTEIVCCLGSTESGTDHVQPHKLYTELTRCDDVMTRCDDYYTPTAL